jgi:hypothetical protein
MIPVTIQTTEWIKFCDTREESTIYLPTNIPAGHKTTLAGRIKAFIKSRDPSPEFETRFCTTDTVSLTATMPGLDMELPGFASEKKTIQISYPLELELENNLRTVSQGSSSLFSWKVCIFLSKIALPDFTEDIVKPLDPQPQYSGIWREWFFEPPDPSKRYGGYVNRYKISKSLCYVYVCSSWCDERNYQDKPRAIDNNVHTPTSKSV